jgi:hypothetical protein
MELNKGNNIYGLERGLLIRNDDYLIKMNNDIYSRNIPDIPLKPNLNVRSVSTKTILYPTLDARNKEKQETKQKYIEYYPETSFAPVYSNGPVKLEKEFINRENELRGQNVPLHSGDLEKLQYIPSVDSSMYRMEIPVPSVNYVQPFPMLFDRPEFSKHLHKNLIDNDIGKGLLNNHTRQQMRNN